MFHFLDVPSRVDCEEYCGKVPECVALVYIAVKRKHLKTSLARAQGPAPVR